MSFQAIANALPTLLAEFTAAIAEFRDLFTQHSAAIQSNTAATAANTESVAQLHARVSALETNNQAKQPSMNLPFIAPSSAASPAAEVASIGETESLSSGNKQETNTDV